MVVFCKKWINYLSVEKNTDGFVIIPVQIIIILPKRSLED